MALTDEQKMQIIKEATASGYKGSFQDLFDQQEAAMAPEQSAQPMEQMPEQPMQPPMQTSDMPSMQQMQDGDLVQSYASEAPGVGNMPMGESVGTILESASTYKEGGFKGIKYSDKYGTTYEEDPDLEFSTGFDDTYNISPRILKDTLKLVDDKVIPSATYSKLVGYEFFKDNVRNKNLSDKDVQEKLQGYSPGRRELMTALNTIIPASEKLSDEEYAGLRNELLGIYDTYKDFDSVSDIPAAYKAVKEQDLSGLKPYREKMGLSQQQLIDLIQVPEDAGFLKRKAINFVKNEMAKKEFEDGGAKSSVTPLDMDYVTYGTKEYNKAYKQGNLATTSYDDQGNVTFSTRMLPEVEIVTDRNAPLSKADQAEYNRFLLDASSGTKAMRRGEEVTDAQRQAANYLTKANPVTANIYRGSDFSDMAESFGYGAVTAPIGGTGFMGTTGATLTTKFAPKVTQLLKKTLKFDPGSSFGAAYNIPKEMIKNRSFFGGLSKYRQGLKGKTKLGTTGNVLKETVGGIHSTFVPGYAMDALSPHKDLEKSALSLTELTKVRHPYANIGVNLYKAGKDVYKGTQNPEDAAYYNTSAGLRLASTVTDKFLPKSMLSKIVDPEQVKSLTSTGKTTFDLFRKGNKLTEVGKE